MSAGGRWLWRSTTGRPAATPWKSDDPVPVVSRKSSCRKAFILSPCSGAGQAGASVQPPVTLRAAVLSEPPSSLRLSYARERAEAAVDRHHGAGDEARGRAAEPEQRRHQVAGLAEAACGCVLENVPAAGRQPAGFVEEEAAVLLGEEEARRDRVHPQAVAEAAGAIDG